MTFKYKKSKGHDGEGHVDDWLMTYADMITLLLCFFAIFLSVSSPKEDKFQEARQEMIQKFAPSNVMEGKFPIKPNNQTGGMANKALDNMPSIVDKFPDDPETEQKMNAGEAQALKDKDKDADFDQQPDKRDRITTIDMNSATFFPSGSATLSAGGQQALIKILQDLNTSQYKDFVITVEGHTDDNPISTAQFPSNWELSTARAAAVVRFFIQQGIPGQKLRAAGYADVMPKVPNRDDKGNPIPDNQAQNRRVVIKLEKVDKAEEAKPALSNTY